MTATVADRITDPGIYDIPADEYHADPIPGGSLSSSGARKLLAPSCPAIFRYERDNPQPYRKTFDIGTAAHDVILGGGPELVLVDRDRWDTKEVKAEIAEIRERGAIPLKRGEFEQIHAMAAELRAHPIASALFDPARGKAEQSLFWQDERTGIWLRARLDWLPDKTRRRLIVGDYKTAVSADPKKFAKSAADFGYHCQDAWYSDAIVALGLDPDPSFVFVVQQKTAPYVVSVIELDDNALRIGWLQNRRAIDTYIHCTQTGRWPGYTDDVEQVSLPYWVEKEFEDQT